MTPGPSTHEPANDAETLSPEGRLARLRTLATWLLTEYGTEAGRACGVSVTTLRVIADMRSGWVPDETARKIVLAVKGESTDAALASSVGLCPQCAGRMPTTTNPGSPRRYCSPACRLIAWRRQNVQRASTSKRCPGVSKTQEANA